MIQEINFNTMYEDATDFDCLLGLKVKKGLLLVIGGPVSYS